MTAVLPGLAALQLDGVLVATRRSAVLHVATPGGAGLTPTGRLRRGHTPVCGQRARRWTSTQVDGRRLCTRCTGRLPDPAGLPAIGLAADAGPARTAAAELLADTFRTAQDHATVHAAVMALCAAAPGVMVTLVDGPDGYPVHVTAWVAEARTRLSRPTSQRWAS